MAYRMHHQRCRMCDPALTSGTTIAAHAVKQLTSREASAGDVIKSVPKAQVVRTSTDYTLTCFISESPTQASRPPNAANLPAQEHRAMQQQRQPLQAHTECDIQLAISNYILNQFQSLRRATAVYSVP